MIATTTRAELKLMTLVTNLKMRRNMMSKSVNLKMNGHRTNKAANPKMRGCMVNKVETQSLTVIGNNIRLETQAARNWIRILPTGRQH
jgi:hypothetical protein